VNRVRIGYFSISENPPDGDPRPYLEWHQLDHMPEQYLLPGLVFGQRWAATPACVAARAAAERDWGAARHVVCYLMGDPVDETLELFLSLGRQLGQMGRFSTSLPSTYRAALRLLEAHAAPRAQVSNEVVPYRPNTGVYLLVEEPTDRERLDDHLRQVHAEGLPRLLRTPGVAGAWLYATSPELATSPRLEANFSPGNYRVTVLYLDEDPVEVAGRLSPLLEERWDRAPVRPVLAAPFESMMRWDWGRFGPSNGE